MAKKRKDAPHRSGFCAIIGRPNVGKSTLLNRLLGEKISIVSHKPQTTRNRVLGILNRPDAQIAFLDTPGIHRARGGLNKFMVDQALGALTEVDCVLFLIEPGLARDPAAPAGVRAEIGEVNQFIVDKLRASGKQVVLGINKIDTVPRHELLPVMDAWKDALPFAAIYPFSALEGDGVQGLADLVASQLPEGPPLFPPDMYTDAAERFLVSEFVREQILRCTRQEVPYSTAVVVESFDESEREREGRGLVRIFARIYVERDSQKAIVIGRRGEMLKRIGTSARLEIERLLGCKVFLALEVTVEPRWSERTDALRRLGYSE